MKPLRVFISSVQKEFEAERATLRDYLQADPLLRRCREAGLSEPEFAVKDGFVTTLRRNTGLVASSWSELITPTGEVTGEVAGEVVKLLWVCQGEMTRRDLQKALLLKGQDHFRRMYLLPALEARLIEMTIPDKPNSRLQKYRLTEKGSARIRREKRKP